MKRDNYKTDILFRVDTTKDFKGTVYALFPHEVADHYGHVTSYQHIGQHHSADYQHCIRTSRPANKDEYKDLKAELEGIGYNINLVKKQNYNKYLESLTERRKDI